jgi:hypothetical protein
MINVFLDDKRPAPKGFYLVRTAERCIEVLESKKIKVISLDYNLGFEKPTGFKVAQYMVSNKIFPKIIIIHSANPFGQIKMYDLLINYKPRDVHVCIQPLPYPLSITY